jgi:hypothetical protein
MGPYRSPTGKHAAHPPSRAAAAEGIHNTRRCERSNRRGRGESQDHKSRAPASRWALPSAPALTRSAMPEHQRQIAIPQRRRPRSNLFSSASQRSHFYRVAHGAKRAQPSVLRYIAISNLDEERRARYANTAKRPGDVPVRRPSAPENGMHAPTPNLPHRHESRPIYAAAATESDAYGAAQADPAATNISEIASRYGFTELGCLAGLYRTIFAGDAF